MDHPVAYGIAAAAIIVGTLFSLIGVLGLFRFPDVYTRLHATGKVAIFGVSILLVADVVTDLAGAGKSLVLMAFLVLAGPTVSHLIAAAARSCPAASHPSKESEPQ